MEARIAANKAEISRRINENKDFFLDSISELGLIFLQDASEEIRELKGDKEVMLAVVNQNGVALEYVSEELKGDKEVVMVAVNQDGYALKYASEELKGDKEVVLAARQDGGGSWLWFASDELKGDKEVVMAAVNHDGITLGLASDELKGDKEVVKAAVKSHNNRTGEAKVKWDQMWNPDGGPILSPLHNASEELKGNKEVVMAAVNQDGYALLFASEELKGDKEMVLAAVNQDGEALVIAPEELKGNKEVVLAAVNQYGLALEFASDELKGNKEVVLAAVKQCGEALEFASEEMKGDKYVVLAAVNQYGEALEFASEEMKGDKEVVLAAVHESENALECALPILRNGGLQSYVAGLLNAYTLPSSAFLGTILCCTKLHTPLTPGVDGNNSPPVAKEEKGEARGTLTDLSSRAEAFRICLLPKLDLGDETTTVLMKKIAAFAGVRCQEFYRVPWSHVVTVAQKLGVGA